MNGERKIIEGLKSVVSADELRGLCEKRIATLRDRTEKLRGMEADTQAESREQDVLELQFFVDHMGSEREYLIDRHDLYALGVVRDKYGCC